MPKEQFHWGLKAKGRIASKIASEFEKESGGRKLPKGLKASKHLAHRLCKKKDNDD